MAQPTAAPRRRTSAPRGQLQQEGFSALWVLVSLLVQAVLTGALLFALPIALPALDLGGYHGITVAVPVWLVGGVLIGMISPSRTYAEPVAGTVVVAIPAAAYLHAGQTVWTMPWFMYAIFAVMGVLFSLVGTFAGQRIQMGPSAKAAD
jgi:hypothetical protein